MVLRGTLLLLGFDPCCKFPGVLVRGTAFGSVGVTGTVDGCVVLGDVVVPGVETPGLVVPGVVTLLGTVLDGTVDGCVVGDGCVTVLPGFAAPGRSDGCTMAPGTVLGCVVFDG